MVISTVWAKMSRLTKKAASQYELYNLDTNKLRNFSDLSPKEHPQSDAAELNTSAASQPEAGRGQFHW